MLSIRFFSRFQLLTAALVLALGAHKLHAAPTDDARLSLETGIGEVAAALQAQAAETDLLAALDKLGEKHFAFVTTTRLAVGPAWRDFSPEQRSRATTLFSQLLLRTYAARLREEARPSDGLPAITYGTPVELRPGRVEVPTTARSRGETYAITYRLELDASQSPGRWRVYDVVAEGVSLIANYRAQFEPMLKDSGPEGLLRALEEKLASPTASSAATPATSATP
jgi:phospholipid transport system substrate-binding protein